VLPGGRFEPRTITLGPRGEGGVYQVLGGLNEGDRVVTSGQFMLDSESQLREAIQKMLEPKSPGAPSGEAKAGPSVSAASPAPAAGTNAIFICPMPEHVSIQYDHSGNCPLCGMTLVPVSRATLDKIQPGGRIAYYTCPMSDDGPMPNHALVRLDKHVKCPLCGMTLIPVMETAETLHLSDGRPCGCGDGPARRLPEMRHGARADHRGRAWEDGGGELAQTTSTLISKDMKIFPHRQTLTLTLSHPMGEGTGCGSSSLFALTPCGSDDRLLSETGRSANTAAHF
jgi:hypothetical protein